ncbi:MAP domain-containing protein [Aquimarina aquimarini]|uniref:MAP domain-containing protein n=1 Tax=Aquimarina aquimarini TaxID=1191734 RepID=UPI00210167EF|nr:MAP domain-containing protein [Aquimarina aquimarini]
MTYTLKINTMKKSSRSQFLEIVNVHTSLRDQGKKYDPSMLNIARGIKEERLQLADAAYYSIKFAGNKANIDMFETQDAKEIGITNVTQAKLQKDRLFLCNRIILLAAEIQGDLPGSDSEMKKVMKHTNFDSIKKVSGLQNGVFSLIANKKIIIDERPMQEFATDGNTMLNLGTYFLESPRFIRDDEEFEFNIELGADAPEKALIKVVLAGTVTVPA